MDLFNKYQEKYSIYMNSLNYDIEEIRKSIHHPQCPDYVRDTLFSTLRLLQDKYKDYEYQHHLILQDPQNYERTIIQFLDNVG